MDIETFILQELHRANDRMPEDKANSIFIRCPNPQHSGGFERSPSLRIFTQAKMPRFKCYGCGWKGTWNDLADTLGLQRLNAAVEINDIPKEIISSSDLNNFLGFSHVVEQGRIKEREVHWYPDTVWRELPGPLLTKVGALLVINDRAQFRIRFPAYYLGKRVGHVTAMLFKPTNKAIPSYLESTHKTGRMPWSHRHVLFHDIAREILKKDPAKPLFVVEGPRDALKLLQYGIAAVALMGTQKTEDAKIETLIRMNARKIVILMDGDDAGRSAAQVLRKKLTRQYASVSRVKLPEGTDPFMLPKKTARSLERLYRS
jgi:5S rRNA maturation endonuclease (ribonuclease M5)